MLLKSYHWMDSEGYLKDTLSTKTKLNECVILNLDSTRRWAEKQRKSYIGHPFIVVTSTSVNESRSILATSFTASFDLM